jgi:hypothetical protein
MKNKLIAGKIASDHPFIVGRVDFDRDEMK